MAGDAVRLDGGSLTVDDLIRVVRESAPVVVDPEAMGRVESGFRLLLQAAKEGIPIYGLNQGSG